jgi:hypothetical protein
MSPLARAIQRWRTTGCGVNPPADQAQLEALERFAGFALPADVRAYFQLANGMADLEMDEHGVAFWSIERTLSDIDGPALAFADVLINSWYFWLELCPAGNVVVRSGVDPSFEAESLTDFFRISLHLSRGRL